MAHVDQNNAGAELSIKGFLVLSRIPFLSPGLAAIVTGIVLAAILEGVAAPGLVWMSVGGIVLIMLATYYFNEYYDFEGDIINKKFIRFSGGSRAIPDLHVPRKVARTAGWGAVVGLVVIALLYMLLYFEDFPLLLPLALLGAFCGIFYSHPPFQWAYKGIGEVMIGGCYGVLAVVSGFYLTSGVLSFEMVVVAIPASLTVFGIIVANEFPDYEADKAVNKKNLIVRFGIERGSYIYMAAMALTYPAMLTSTLVGMPWTVAVTGLPVLLFTAAPVALVLRGGLGSPPSQTTISGLTIVANVFASVMFIPAVWLGT
ncbi:MAG: prenyltransferase [Thermoplasmata archaeon]